MAYQIVQAEELVEVHVSGRFSHWDMLKATYDLYMQDPKKEKPDLWILDETFDFPLASYPSLVHGIMKLIARCSLKKGCKSAILAVDAFQRIKAEIYCEEAADLPYEIRTFASREQAEHWLLN